MWPVSDAYRRHITTEHQVTTVVMAQPDLDAPLVDMSAYFVNGSINVARQSVRRSGTLTFTDDGTGAAIPKTPDHPLAPYGQELAVSHGLVYPDGTEELVPVGMLRITGVNVRYPLVTVTVNDRAWTVGRAQLEKPRTIGKGTNYVTAITNVLTTAYPQIVLTMPADIEHNTPLIVMDEQADPWEQAQSMATAIGYELSFDPLGACHMVSEDDLADLTPVWTFDAKPSAGLPIDLSDWYDLALYDMQADYDTEGAYNAVVATGESTSNTAPVRGVAYDADPMSPTRYGGRFGKNPLFWSSPLITTTTMASASARTLLQKHIGIAESITIPAVANPAYEVGDPVLVRKDELDMNAIHVLDAFNIPLRADTTQSLSTRMRRVVIGFDPDA